MPLRLAILLISASSLGFEVYLTRLFAIIQWHHFAFWMISLALLGFGASGTFLTLWQRFFLPRWRGTFFTLTTLLGFSFVGTFYAAQRIPFNPLEILWDPSQALYLISISLLLFIPFFLAGTCLGLAFTRFQREINSLYRFDLIGAGLGALLLLGLLHLLPPGALPRALAPMAFIASILFFIAYPFPMGRYGLIVPVLGILLATFFWPHSWSRLQPSPYKNLSKTLLIPGTKVLHRSSNPLGQLTVVESPIIPFRHAPGLSLTSDKTVPLQLGLFIDGEGPSPMTRFTGELEALAYLDDLTSALPYHLLKKPEVLILGAGGGQDLLQAMLHQSSYLEVVDQNPQVLHLLDQAFRDYTGNLFQREEIHPAVGDAREYVVRGKSSGKKFDLIQISLMDSFGPTSAGLYALSETYLYTVEALRDYLARLKPGGFLAITRWLRLPPRDGLKLIATAKQSLLDSGFDQPGFQLALIRSWKTLTLLVKNGNLSSEEIASLKKFSQGRGFDLVYYPGIEAKDANRFNLLDQPYFFQGAQALLGPGAEKFFQNYKFNVRPATDDRPFFFHFLKWRTLPELYRLKSQGGLPLIEWGFPILVAVLIQVSLIGIFLILLPLLWLRKKTSWSHGGLAVGIYFTALGLAFLFIEITTLQLFILYLGHPTYAVAFGLAGFLIFAGLGSGYAHRFTGKPLIKIFLPLALVGILLLVGLPILNTYTMGLSWGLRLLISLAGIAPLAFLMGMPFPLGWSYLGQREPEVVPWAWGINGCASVLSPPLATLLALSWGFTWVWGVALLLYLLAGSTFYLWTRRVKLA